MIPRDLLKMMKLIKILNLLTLKNKLIKLKYFNIMKLNNIWIYLITIHKMLITIEDAETRINDHNKI